jgi:hypothetical protein
MAPVERTHLDQLENQSIFIFREAYHAFKNIAMPWPMGKDSNVLGFTDQHSVDESVATILERLLPRLREYGANE